MSDPVVGAVTSAPRVPSPRSWPFSALVVAVAMFAPLTVALGSSAGYAIRYGLVVLVVLRCRPSTSGSRLRSPVARCAVGLCVLYLASAAWASSPLPAVFAAADLALLTIVAVVVAPNGFAWVARALARSAQVLVLGSAVGIVLDPGGRAFDAYGRLAVHGFLTNENEFGRLMFVCAVVLVFAAAVLGRRVFLVGGLVGAVLAVLSGSIQVIVVGACGLVIGAVVALANHSGSERRGVRWVFALFPAVGLVLLLVNNVATVLSYLGRDSSLTNRVPLWEAILDAMSGHWTLGYGASTVWSGSTVQHEIAAKAGFLPAHAHNSFLEVALQVGVVGVVLLALLLAAAFVSGIRARSNEGTMLSVLAVCLFLYSFSAALFGRTPADVYWLVLITLAVSIQPVRLSRGGARQIHPPQREWRVTSDGSKLVRT